MIFLNFSCTFGRFWAQKRFIFAIAWSYELLDTLNWAQGEPLKIGRFITVKSLIRSSGRDEKCFFCFSGYGTISLRTREETQRCSYPRVKSEDQPSKYWIWLQSWTWIWPACQAIGLKSWSFIWSDGATTFYFFCFPSKLLTQRYFLLIWWG